MKIFRQYCDTDTFSILGAISTFQNKLNNFIYLLGCILSCSFDLVGMNKRAFYWNTFNIGADCKGTNDRAICVDIFAVHFADQAHYRF